MSKNQSANPGAKNKSKIVYLHSTLTLARDRKRATKGSDASRECAMASHALLLLRVLDLSRQTLDRLM